MTASIRSSIGGVSPSPDVARLRLGLVEAVVRGEYAGVAIAVAGVTFLAQMWTYGSVFLAALGLAACNEKRHSFMLSTRQASAAAVVIVTGGVAFKLILNAMGIMVLVWLLSAAAVLKLVSHRRLRDHLQVMALATVIMGAASVLTTLPFYLPLLIAFATSTIWTMIALTTLAGVERCSNNCVWPAQAGTPGRRLFRPAIRIALAAFVVAGFFFVLIPRVRPNFLWLRPKQAPVATSGFSPVVGLGDISAVVPSDRRVFQVALFKEGEPYLADDRVVYMKGIALARYDDRHRWREAPTRVQPAGESVGWLPKRFLGRGFIEQRFARERLDTNAVFGWPEMVAFWSAAGFGVEVRVSALPGGTGIESMELQVRPAAHTYPLEYTVLSRDMQLSPEVLEECKPFSDADARLLAPYLDTSNFSPRVIELARRICPPDRYRTPYAKVRRIEEYVRENCSYALESPRTAPVDPIEQFLFTTKRGYCELFASAMVAMCRAVGVPARLATGFAGGEYNRLDKTYIFRQSHAHAWAEVLYNANDSEAPCAGRVWQIHDPTPVGVYSDWNLKLKTGWLKSLYYWVADRWYKHVVDYGPRNQRTLLSKALGASAAATRSLEALAARIGLKRFSAVMPSRHGVVAVIVVGAVIAAILALALLGRSRMRQPDRHGRRRRSPIKFYRGMLLLLSRSGHEKKADETVNEFLARLDVPQAAMGPARELAVMYEHVRFGRKPLCSELRRRASRLLGRLKAAL